jgi:ubiquinone/menaquinone biosynthesis C-methylase UbiE
VRSLPVGDVLSPAERVDRQHGETLRFSGLKDGDQVAETSRAANAAQAQRWNGEGGQYWIAHRERHLAEQQHLLPHLFAAADISPGERVLDVGCGCGATTIEAARSAGGGELSPRGCAVGLDLSRPMLAVARQLAQHAGVFNVGFVQADAQTCPLRRYSCDVMVSSFGVMFFDDPAAAFASIATTLRNGGRLAFLCWQRDMRNELFAIPLRAFGAYMQLPGPTVGDMFTDPRQVTDLLSSTGWKNIRIDAVSEPAWIGSDVADVMSYVRGMSTTRSLTADLGDEKLTQRVFATITEQYAARLRSDGVWVRAAAWLVTARRA